MQVHRDINRLPVFQKSVVTIGTFDGVHLGHQKILAQMRKEAREIEGETVIVTFHPHPRKVIASSQPDIQLLNTIEEKTELLDKLGMDHLVVVPFSQQFSQMQAKEYIEDFLYQKFQPHTIIIGYDHHFGQGRSGNYLLLEEYSQKLGFKLKEISPHIINEIAVSSTRIRQALLNGNIDIANNLLGYDYFFEGTVVEGNKIGKTLGYPTANLEMENDEKLVPGNGVYAVEAEVRPDMGYGIWDAGYGNQGEQFKKLNGMMNIGIRPTIGGSARTIEVNLFDFSEDIYSKTLRVYLKSFLREEKKFNGLEELKTQLAKDKITASAILKN